MEPVDYLDCDRYGPHKVRCMNGCRQVIAKRKTLKTSAGEKTVLLHNIISRRFPVKVRDGTVANMLVCKKCLDKGGFDLEKFEATMFYGWEKTQKAVYSSRSREEYASALRRVQEMKRLKSLVK